MKPREEFVIPTYASLGQTLEDQTGATEGNGDALEERHWDRIRLGPSAEESLFGVRPFSSATECTNTAEVVRNSLLLDYSAVYTQL
jgi:hypothetical protein